MCELKKYKWRSMTGERILRLAVDPNDSLYQEETESDPDSDEDDDEVILNNTGEPVPGTSGHRGNGTEDARVLNPIEKTVNAQEEINEIDDQMVHKINQLHKEMTSQGMHKAADLLKGCFGAEMSGAPAEKQRSQQIHLNPEFFHGQTNTNPEQECSPKRFV